MLLSPPSLRGSHVLPDHPRYLSLTRFLRQYRRSFLFLSLAVGLLNGGEGDATLSSCVQCVGSLTTALVRSDTKSPTRDSKTGTTGCPLSMCVQERNSAAEQWRDSSNQRSRLYRGQKNTSRSCSILRRVSSAFLTEALVSRNVLPLARYIAISF